MMLITPRPLMASPVTSTFCEPSCATLTPPTSAHAPGFHHLHPSPLNSPHRSNDFTRWRPSFHLIAPKNWMNDPCGPCYDERTGLFHVLYQYNPKGATWGNMSWLHATSKDLVHWTHLQNDPTLIPATPQDCEGVFSGAMVPHGPKGEPEMLTVFYTAVSALPIHFTLPYQLGCEKIAMATSSDGGKTWQRNTSSVLVDSPPIEHGDKITSWRDPFISAWPEMDDHLGLPRGRYVYGLVSGGLRDETPTAFMYRIEKSDMSRWTFVSTIANVGYHHRTHELSPEMGRNWEVCNFFTLHGKQFILFNAEGVGADLKQRQPMWAQVVLDKSTGSSSGGSGLSPSVTLVPCKSGLMDHGCLYAATTSFHQPSARRLLWGWVPEEDLAEERYERQGWAGCIALPREIVTQMHKNISVTSASDPLVLSMFDVTHHTSGTIDAQMPGVRPADELVGLRSDAVHLQTRSPAISLSGYAPTSIRSRNFEASLTFRVCSTSGLRAADEIGMIVATNRQKTQGTKIVYRDNAVHIFRAFSSSDKDVNRDTIVAPMPLLQYADGSYEDVELRIFLDNSVLEVFVNERTAITTRIYCDDNTVDMVHLVCRTDTRKQHEDELFASSSSSRTCVRASLQTFDAWIGLQHAMLSDPTGHGAFKSLDRITANESSTDSGSRL